MASKTFKDIELVSDDPGIPIILRFPRQDESEWLARFWDQSGVPWRERLTNPNDINLVDFLSRIAAEYMQAQNEPETFRRNPKSLLFIASLASGQKLGTFGILRCRWDWRPNRQQPRSIKFIVDVGGTLNFGGHEDLEKCGSMMCVKLITEFAFNEYYNKENGIQGNPFYVDTVECRWEIEDESSLEAMRDHFRWHEEPGYENGERDGTLCFYISRDEYEEQVKDGTFYSKDIEQSSLYISCNQSINSALFIIGISYSFLSDS
ncbi:hypothetical protein HYFRA_00013069 [Hymenoscyphus fraxineus]|uniref:Uncharacterized protein n=1 Tax=Hymenoscyphus fraxineus TaxID=746836 RepID=A0A9N9PM74_9HELO|nr:hypothetical protein HYFRA_00013069 [Hymenoscyphus fraxineus]